MAEEEKFAEETSKKQERIQLQLVSLNLLASLMSLPFPFPFRFSNSRSFRTLNFRNCILKKIDNLFKKFYHQIVTTYKH